MGLSLTFCLGKQEKFHNENLLEQWNDVLLNYDYYEKNALETLKNLTLKGIPDCYREILWQKYTNCNLYKKDSYFTKGLSFSENFPTDHTDDDNNTNELYKCNIPITSDYITIFKDIDRTFPNHTLYKDRYSTGQKSLYKILSAYSKFNTNVGYVQGMGFICAVFRTYLDEEYTFWQIHTLMISPKYQLQDIYALGFPKLKLIYYTFLSLLKEFNEEVYYHFVHLNLLKFRKKMRFFHQCIVRNGFLLFLLFSSIFKS